MKQNSELRSEARQALKGNWVEAAVVALVFLVVASVLTSSLSFVDEMKHYSFGLSILTLPLDYGITVLFLHFIRKRSLNMGELFEYYKETRVWSTMLLRVVYVFLWSLLFIIPGVIKYYSYFLTPFIMDDDPTIKNNEAIEKSMAMMQGHKMKLFLLDLSFLGWALLCIFTFGIGIFFLVPYMQTAYAAFYEDVKEKND